MIQFISNADLSGYVSKFHLHLDLFALLHLPLIVVPAIEIIEICRSHAQNVDLFLLLYICSLVYTWGTLNLFLTSQHILTIDLFPLQHVASSDCWILKLNKFELKWVLLDIEGGVKILFELWLDLFRLRFIKIRFFLAITNNYNIKGKCPVHHYLNKA